MKNDILGELELVECYEIYEAPKLFLVKNSFNHLFLYFWAETNELEGCVIYLISAATQEVVEGLRNRRVDYATAFSQHLIVARHYFSGAVVSHIITREEADEKGLLPPPIFSDGFWV